MQSLIEARRNDGNDRSFCARLLLGGTMIALLCWAVFRETLIYWFTGVDALPLILSSDPRSL